MSQKVLMKGNEAIAEAAILAGCRHFFGYPITPQTEISAYMSRKMPKIGGLYLQAESEVAAINMVIGAASAGVRSMTSSSSPGIALKSEGLSYLAGCDLPAVVVNVQRGGPGLGGIQPSQADYNHAIHGGGHGDFKMIVLAPNSVQEMLDFTIEAFYLSDKYRMTALILADGILGQMMEPVDLTPKEKPLLPEKDWALTGRKNGRKKNIINSLYLNTELLEQLNIDRYKKYEEVEKNEPKAELYQMDDAEIVLVAYGATSRICKNVIADARKQGIKVGLIRPITLWPFPQKELLEAADKAKALISVEMNMGQMIRDVELAIKCKKPVLFSGRTGGMVHTPEDIMNKIIEAKGV